MIWQILKNSFNGTISIVESVFLVLIVVVFIVGWFYVPFGIMNINRKLKKTNELLKEIKDKISLD